MLARQVRSQEGAAAVRKLFPGPLLLEPLGQSPAQEGKEELQVIQLTFLI